MKLCWSSSRRRRYGFETVKAPTRHLMVAKATVRSRQCSSLSALSLTTLSCAAFRLHPQKIRMLIGDSLLRLPPQ